MDVYLIELCNFCRVNSETYFKTIIYENIMFDNMSPQIAYHILF